MDSMLIILAISLIINASVLIQVMFDVSWYKTFCGLYIAIAGYGYFCNTFLSG